MTLPNQDDATTTREGAARERAADAERGVRGGDPGRMDAAPGSGGMPSAGADGETGAREQLRKDLGERPADAGEDTGTPLEQSPLGATDDPGNAGIGA
jgi:hypothetical protein